MGSPLDTLHNPIVLSEDPDAKYFQFGQNITLHTGEEWPVRVFMHSPFDTIHTRIVYPKIQTPKTLPPEKILRCIYEKNGL